MRRRLTFLAALLLALAPAAGAKAQERAPEAPHLVVAGSGEARLEPDFALIHIAVETEGDSLAGAASANNAASERAIARILALGVARRDVRTVNFQLYRKHDPDPRSGEKPPRFAASHQIEIKSADIEGVGKLAGGVIATDAVAFRSVTFGLEKQEAGEDAAREAAVRDARRKADVYARAAGVRIVRILSIGEGAEAGRPPMPAMRMSMAAESGEVPLVPPDSISYEADVRIVFEIAPAP